MNENETLRSPMWDLCYGLLTAEEAAALHKQIKSDPAAARLYAEVRLQADLVASAAKIEDESVSLSVPDEGRKVQPAAKSSSVVGESPFKAGKAGKSGRRSSRVRSYRMANWLAGLAAVVLVGLIGYGLYAPAKPGVSSVSDTIVASVYANQPIQSGLSQKFKVVATNSRGEPRSTELSYFVTHGGKVVEENTVRTDELGEAELNVSGSAIQPGAVLEVDTREKHKWAEQSPAYFQHRYAEAKDGVALSANLVVPLAANPEPVISDVRLEQDSYELGDTCRFWVHSRGAFSNQPAVEAEEWKLVAQDGREIAPSAIKVNEEAGVVSGEFQLPADGAKGFYSLRGVNRKAGTESDLEQIPVGVEAEQTAQLAFRNRLLADNRTTRMQMLKQETLAELAADKEGEKQRLEMATIRQKDQLAGVPGSRSGGFPPGPAPANAHAPTPEATPPLTAPAKAPAAPSRMAKGSAPGGSPLAASPSREKESPKKEAAQEELSKSSNSEAAKKVVEAATAANEDRDAQRVPGQNQQDEQKSYDRVGDGKKDIAEKGIGELDSNDLVVEVPAPLAHMNLLAVVTKSNIPVARQRYLGRAVDDANAKKYKESGAANGSAPVPATEPGVSSRTTAGNGVADQLAASGHLTVPLPPEADGELGVTLYDQDTTPPKAVYGQIVRRASLRDLSIDVQPDDASRSQDGEMRLKLTVRDRNGNAVPHSHFAARIIKADAIDGLAAEGAPAGGMRYSADKQLNQGALGGQLPGLPGGMGGGAGFGGGGKGVPGTDPGAKADKNEAKKEIAPRDGKQAEAKLKKAQDGSAKPSEPTGDPAAVPAPAAEAAAPAVVGKLSGDKDKAPKDPVNLYREEDRATPSMGLSEKTLESTPLDFADHPFSYSQAPADTLTIAPQEVLLATNGSLIEDATRAGEAAAQAEHARFQGTIGRLVLVAAAAALLLFGLLAILHRPAQAKVWVPAMVVVAGSFGVGCVWLMNGRLARQEIAGHVARNADPATPAELRTDQMLRPMAPARSLPPSIDEVRNEVVLEGGNSEAIGPTVAPPAGRPGEEADNKPAPMGLAPRGGGFAGGKPGAIATAESTAESPKPAPAAKPESTAKSDSAAKLESFEKKNEPAPAPPRTRTTDDNRKFAENRSNSEPENSGSAKDSILTKKKMDGLSGPKPAAAKSGLSGLQSEKRAKGSALLFAPNIPADDKGEAQLSFPLPQEAGEYYLLVDVQGPGGVGTVQTRIPVRAPSPASPAAPASPTKP